MKKFDQDYRGKAGVKDSGRGWFVQENGKRYPPKLVLSLATGVPRSEFFGGQPTNNIFLALNFDVRELDDEIVDGPNPHFSQLGRRGMKFVRIGDCELISRGAVV
jgi:hypothetical protein